MLDPVKILVVDDLPEKLLVYRAVLDQPEVELVEASSGSEALKQVLQHDFAVILLDINMPDMDGFETAQLIRSRKRCAHTPIIFITSYADELHALKGYAHGAVDYILAPVVPEVLKSKVGVFVQLFRQTLEVQRQAERLREMQIREHRRQLNETNQRLQFALQAGRMGAWEWELDLQTARNVLSLDDTSIQNGVAADAPGAAPSAHSALLANSALVNWSPTLEEIFGFSPGEFTGAAAQLHARVHHEDAARVINAIAHSAVTGQELQLEHRIMRGSQVAWVEVRGRLLDQSATDPQASGDAPDSHPTLFKEHDEQSSAAVETSKSAALQEALAASARSNRASVAAARKAEAPVNFERSRTVRLVGVCMDITQRKAAEEELTSHRGRLEELVRHRTLELEQSLERLRLADRLASIGTLAAGLGHDMGNLLLPIRMRLETLQKSIDGWDAAAERSSEAAGRVTAAQLKAHIQRDLQAIATSTEYLKRLSQGLRLFSLDPQEISGVSQSTDLESWWPDVEPFLRNALPRQVRLETGVGSLQSSMQPLQSRSAAATREATTAGGSEHDSVRGGGVFAGLPPIAMASHRFTQAIYNLVQNAGEVLRDRPKGVVRIIATAVNKPSASEAPHAARGGLDFPGALMNEPHSQYVVVSISDDGPGMTEETKRRCMEPFFTTKTRAISTGLGLALVRGAVTQAGGHIEIESSPGAGATFRLWLPVCRTRLHESASEPGSRISGPTTACVRLSDVRMNAYVSMLLQSQGIEVCRGPWNADSAVQLLVLDHPNGQLAEVEAFVRKDSRRRAVIIADDPAIQDRLASSQIMFVEPKPAPPRLREVIHSVLAGSASSQPQHEP